MEINELYYEAAEKLGWPNSASCINYLKELFTPEEGRLLLEFIKPTTCAQVAKKLGMDEKDLQAKLDNFTHKRRLLFHGKTEYVFQLGLHGFFNAILVNREEDIPPGFWRFYAEFHKEEMLLNLPERIRRLDANPGGLPGQRVVPHRLALAASPKIKKEDILWYEDMAQILAKEDVISLAPCGCRKEFHNCDKPIWTCFHFGEAEKKDANPENSVKKILTLEEAIEASDMCEKAGLLHLVGNNIEIPKVVLCHCCNDCCSTLTPIMATGRLRQFYAPSRYLAVVDEEKCVGCQDCMERCYFSAVMMRPSLTSKKKKAHVLSWNCMGCGSCILGCKQGAITFELVRPPEHIPTQPPAHMSLAGVPGFTYIRQENLK
jgi:NAD-dependent dihydropyrimidine dehydrogenase PreA subunit